jgi:hypothetical protein
MTGKPRHCSATWNAPRRSGQAIAMTYDSCASRFRDIRYARPTALMIELQRHEHDTFISRI